MRLSALDRELVRSRVETRVSGALKRFEYSSKGAESSKRTGRNNACRAIAGVGRIGAVLWAFGCGGGGGGSVGPPPPPPSIQVVVTPKSGSVILGNTANFSASVSNTTDQTVNWSVNGIAGGDSTVGTITTNGVYTAPAALPS